VSEALKPLLADLAAGRDVDHGALEHAFGEIMDGAATSAQIGAFLALTLPLMTEADVLAAGARAMRARMLPVEAPAGAIDVCGTGGDGAHTLNISTAVALVVAGCGVPVAKHGNRAMSSKSGAADVLEALGVKLTADPATLARCLREARVAFLFAQNHHPAMRNVAASRRELGFRTLFNLIGPLTNPAGVKRQLVGVYSTTYMAAMLGALGKLGAERASVVVGAGDLDELSCSGPNTVVSMNVLHEINAEEAGLGAFGVESVRGGDAAFNAAALRALLENRASGSGYEAFVLLNAGAALVIAGAATSTREGVEMARTALASGAALGALQQLIAITGSAP
jgi:anthranilate phosphoribosyltransferase